MTGALAMMRASLRTLLRSRLAPVMLFAVLAATALLPMAMRGDGTLEGLNRLHLTYTLGLASFLLGLFSLWTGCAGISREAETKTLHLLVTKPVPRLSIWLGKWLALLVLDAALLAAAVAASAATLALRVHGGDFTDAQRAETLPRSLASLPNPPSSRRSAATSSPANSPSRPEPRTPGTSPLPTDFTATPPYGCNSDATLPFSAPPKLPWLGFPVAPDKANANLISSPASHASSHPPSLSPHMPLPIPSPSSSPTAMPTAPPSSSTPLTEQPSASAPAPSPATSSAPPSSSTAAWPSSPPSD